MSGILGRNDPNCPSYASIYSYMGIAIALAFTAIGSGYGTAKSSIGLFKVCIDHPEQIYRGLMPVIMAGIVGIYGLVAAIIITPSMNDPYSLYNGYSNFAGGICVGLSGLASGVCIGVAGDVAVRAMSMHPELLMGAMLILIFGEVLGLYGFIIAIILNGKNYECVAQ